MSKQNFGKQVISGLVSSYGPAASAYNEQQLQDQKLLQKNLEQQREDLIRQNDLSIIQKLVGQEALPGTDTSTPDNQLSGAGLSDKGSILLNRYLDIRNKMNPKTKYREYQGNLYPVDQQGNIDLANPVATKTTQKKRIATISGVNDQGYKTSEVYYDDGTSDVYTSDLKPVYKEPLSSKSLFEISDNQFNDRIKNYVGKAGVIAAYKSEYQNPKNSASRNTSIEAKNNSLAFDNEQAIYNQLDPISTTFVKRFYTNFIKPNPNLSQGDLLNMFTEQLLNAQLNGELSNDPVESSKQIRALGLWAKFKFGYIGNPKNKSVAPKQPVNNPNNQNSSNNDPLGIL